MEDGEPLGYPLLCDPSRAAVKALGVYDRENDIALPSTLIVDGDGRIVWKYVGGTAADRPDEESILQALDGLRGARPGPGDAAAGG